MFKLFKRKTVQGLLLNSNGILFNEKSGRNKFMKGGKSNVSGIK